MLLCGLVYTCLIAATASVPLIGTIHRHYDPRWVLISIFPLFDIGSVICATAQDSVLGNGGSSTGMMIFIMHVIALQKRPIY